MCAMLRVPPVHAGHTLLHDALDLLEHVGVFFIDPVSQISTVIQDLSDHRRQTSTMEGREGEKSKSQGNTDS